MQENPHHLVRLEAIRYIDGELSSAEMERVESHLSQCVECGRLMSELHAGVARLKSLLAIREEQTSGQEQANQRLKMRLEDEKKGWSRFSVKLGMALKFVAAGVVVAFALFGAGRHWFVGDVSRHRDFAMLPDQGLTPGDVRQVVLADICTSEDDDDLDPAVPLPVRIKIFSEYGVSAEQQKKDFQVDYLINPQLGGTNDIHNLWPQPSRSAEWNAEAKDALERHLHRMVCDGKVDLREAQRDIATNWIAAYQKYFHTTKPV